MTSFLAEAAGAATTAVMGLFGYNRNNFKFDRRQRLLMEMQLQDMKLDQVGLWREDVRALMTLTPRKMELYLLVIALELNATATALCKARVPPGTPAWLSSCHTMAVCSALMYLTLALWFGLHAFVSAQAYKVRILTQVVRLPVPSWRAIEASRTYASSFEKLGRGQMFRVPFAEGSQESRCQQTAAAAAEAAASAGGEGERDHHEGVSADPWGLERSGRHIPELQPGVNSTHLERQQHIWHIREAARFYQTYDAFCRVSMSAGTSSIASFFAFFCLSYVLTENAAPVAAWAGMLAFTSISVILLGNDLKVSRRQFLTSIILLVSAPVLCSIVTFVSSKNYGNPGSWEWLMPIALFMKGAWYAYYVYLFKVREMQTGAILPFAFRNVLYVDPFGWAKHTERFLQQRHATRGSLLNAPPIFQSRQRRRQVEREEENALTRVGSFGQEGASQDQEAPPAPLVQRRGAFRRPTSMGASLIHASTLALSARQHGPVDDQTPTEAGASPFAGGDASAGRRSWANILSWRRLGSGDGMSDASPASQGDVARSSEALPTMQCVTVAHPSRPEDVTAPPVVSADAARPTSEASGMYIPHTALRPRMFMNATCLSADESLAHERFESGADINGELPGLVPWRYFFINTAVVACLWWCAAFISAIDAYSGTMTFVQPRYGLEPREVAPLPLLQTRSAVVHPFLRGERVHTTWPMVERSHGLACDVAGGVFVSAGRSASGRRGLLRGRLTIRANASKAVAFDAAPPCPALSAKGSSLQDFSFAGRGKYSADVISVLPTGGSGLVHCPLREGADASWQQPLGRAWLEDRGGVVEDVEDDEDVADIVGDFALQAEELSALTLAPCLTGSGSAQGDGCAVVSTTAKRMVLLGAPASSTTPSPLWVPRQLLRNVIGHSATGPGALALLDGRYLGVLDKANSLLHVLDLQRQGHPTRSWRLPHHGRDGTGAWSSICAGGGAIFAMEDHERPSLWRFPLPANS